MASITSWNTATSEGVGPHIKNVQAGRGMWDPMYQAIFEVAFSLPTSISSKYADTITLMPEQVTEVSGLDALQKTTAAGQQKFMGVDVSFLNPVLDNTYAEITITFNLNLKTDTNAPTVLLAIKDWAKLNYDMGTGARSLMKDYTADFLKINEANRNGDIWRSITFSKVILTEVTGLETLSYESQDVRKLQVKFRCDSWAEQIAGDKEQWSLGEAWTRS